MSPKRQLIEASAFADLPEDVRERLEEVARLDSFAAGETIIQLADEGTALFVLHSGRACATVPDATGALFDDEMEPGSVFGEMSFLTGEPRSARIRALTDCQCAVIDFADLRAVIDAHPRVAQLLTTLVGARLNKRDGIKSVGDYEILRPLGRGGFSTVFRAQHKVSGKLVALKMLKHELMYRSDFAERFRSEARIIQSLVHPNIVRVFGLFEAYATLFLAMELVEGSDLGHLIAARGKLPPSEVRYVTRRVCAALNHAHSRAVVHRDIKPANVLLTADGDVKLVDFGIALGPGDGKRGHTFYGTPHYAAPEHVMNMRVDGRSDIYMLGITVFELLTGDVPYADETVQTTLEKHVREETPALPDDVPADLRNFVATATRRRPRQRFANCVDAAASLSTSAGDEFLRGPVQRDWTNLSFRPTVDVNDARADRSDTTVEDIFSAADRTAAAENLEDGVDSAGEEISGVDISGVGSGSARRVEPRLTGRAQRIDLTMVDLSAWESPDDPSDASQPASFDGSDGVAEDWTERESDDLADTGLNRTTDTGDEPPE